MNYYVNEVITSQEFSFKKFAHAIVSSVAFAIALLVVMWIINYFNVTAQIEVLTSILDFLNAYWIVLVAFVLLISLWDYLYSVYKSKLKYIKPAIDAIGILFGLWIIAIILYGLRVFTETTNPINVFLEFLHTIFYEQTLLLFLLFLFISYSKFFLKDR